MRQHALQTIMAISSWLSRGKPFAGSHVTSYQGNVMAVFRWVYTSLYFYCISYTWMCMNPFWMCVLQYCSVVLGICFMADWRGNVCIAMFVCVFIDMPSGAYLMCFCGWSGLCLFFLFCALTPSTCTNKSCVSPDLQKMKSIWGWSWKFIKCLCS